MKRLKLYVGARKAVNIQLLKTNWEIGRYIVEFEQGGKEKAEYGESLLENLSRDLKLRHGKGFSLSNLIRIRQLYLAFPIYAALPHKFVFCSRIYLLGFLCQISPVAGR